MAEYISGEKHKKMAANQGNKTAVPKPLLAGIVVIVLMGLSFYGGVAYQKSHHPQVAAATAANGQGGFGGRGGRFGGQRPTIGAVTAVNATSITIQDSNSGTSTTLGITSGTQITNSGQTVAASTITVGENVLVVASTSDKTQAARILVNPSFGGGGSQSSSGSSSDPTTTD